LAKLLAKSVVYCYFRREKSDKKRKRPIRMKELFTIGHSNHSLDHFIELLLAHQLSTIADVRSSPYGQAKYDRIAHLSTFRRGLEIVLQGAEHNRIALMCSESDPITCHRTILVSRELKRICPDLKITHILGDGTEERQETSEKRLINFHKLQPELFGDLTSTSGLIEKAYDLQAERISFKKVPIEG
jgi:uncharacterized protein (DUF488 family)